MPVRMKLPVLPVYYYHDHFTEMLFFVSETYRPVLTERHRAFVETFKTLSKVPLQISTRGLAPV